MANSRRTLEGIAARVSVPQPSFDRLMRRRDRKQRNRSIATAALALVLAIVAIGGAIRAFESGGRQMPANRPITPRNVGSLHLLGSTTLGGHLVSVQLSDGLVYVVSRGGGPTKLAAFSTGCTDACRPVWVANTGEADPRNGSSISEGMVYLATDDLYAFSANCGSGGATCDPTWVGHVPGRPFAPVLGPDAAYVVSDRRLYSFPISCGSTGPTCAPNWTSVKLPRTGYNHPVLADGAVYLFSCCTSPATNRYQAFLTDCGTSDATCEPLTDPSPPAPTPTIADGKSFIWRQGRVSSYPGVSAYPPGCVESLDRKAVSPASCRPLWTTSGVSSDRIGFISPGGGLLYLFQHFGGCCHTPNNGGGILAYPTDCGSGNAACKPSWTWGTGDGGGPAVPITSVVTSGSRLFAASNDGRLYVFGLGRRA